MDEDTEVVQVYDPQALRNGELKLREVEPMRSGGSAQELTTTEADALDIMRANAKRAAEGVSTLLEKTIAIEDKDALPSALRAVADVQSKSVDNIQKLTGRDQGPQRENIAETLRGLAGQGLVRLAVEIQPRPDAER